MNAARPEEESRKGKTRCSICSGVGHNRQNCPERSRVVLRGKAARAFREKHCEVCCGLAHRREESPCACGGLYKPLPTVTLRDAMSLPADDKRTFPA